MSDINLKFLTQDFLSTDTDKYGAVFTSFCTLQRKFHNIDLSIEIIKRAFSQEDLIREGYFYMLQPPYSRYAWNHAILTDNKDLLSFMLNKACDAENSPGLKQSRKLLVEFPIISWLSIAITNGKFYALEFIDETYKRAGGNYNKLTMLNTAAATNNDFTIEMMQRLKQLGYVANSFVYMPAVINTNIKVLEWLINEKMATPSNIFADAVVKANLIVAKWVTQKYIFEVTRDDFPTDRNIFPKSISKCPEFLEIIIKHCGSFLNDYYMSCMDVDTKNLEWMKFVVPRTNFWNLNRYSDLSRMVARAIIIDQFEIFKYICESFPVREVEAAQEYRHGYYLDNEAFYTCVNIESPNVFKYYEFIHEKKLGKVTDNIIPIIISKIREQWRGNNPPLSITTSSRILEWFLHKKINPQLSIQLLESVKSKNDLITDIITNWAVVHNQ